MRAILTLSGGLDSAVLLGLLRHQGHEVRCLSVDYGQRHRRELESAVKIAGHYGVEHKVLNLSGLREIMAGSSQTSPIKVPQGHYEEESMKLTVVPNRNMVLLALAGSWAVSTKSSFIAYAAHAGDHAIYPDCRPEFMDAMDEALQLCDWFHVELIAPFREKTKANIVTIGAAIKVPFELTYSCYEGEEVHCGKCGTCTERREAFQVANLSLGQLQSVDESIKDPTTYRS